MGICHYNVTEICITIKLQYIKWEWKIAINIVAIVTIGRKQNKTIATFLAVEYLYYYKKRG
jgi:hypothetical protein